MQGQSLGIDTGMVDGLGLSFNWNPYWATCAVCHPNARPDLVLFADNGMEKDLKVSQNDFLRIYKKQSQNATQFLPHIVTPISFIKLQEALGQLHLP